MEAIRRSFSAVKRCQKSVWKSIKKNSPITCFGRRRSSTKKCTIENVIEDVVAIVAEDNVLHETLTAAKAAGETERTSTPLNSSKTEEQNEPEIHSTEGQPQNVENEEVTKKKRKRGNRKRRKNVESQNAIIEQTMEGEDDEQRSYDPSPIGSIKETASVEIAIDVFPSITKNETECPGIWEFNNESIGDVVLHSQPETALTETISEVSWNIDRLNNNATESLDIQNTGNCENGSADQRPQTLHETSTAETVVNEMERTSTAINFSETEENQQSEISDKEEHPGIVETEETEKKVSKKGKRGNRKRRNNRNVVESQNAIKDQIIEGEGDEKKSFDPSSISSREGTVSVETVINVLPNVSNSVTESPEIREFNNESGGDGDLHSQTKPVIKISSVGEGLTKRKVVHMVLSSNKNIVLDKTDNAWVPATAARREATDAEDVAIANKKSNAATEETNKSVRSILNKLTSEKLDQLIKNFKALPLNTIERLENAVDLVFEGAIQEQRFAPLYAVLCAAMQSVQATCTENKKTVSFKSLIIKKCQRFFESDKTYQTYASKRLEEIKSCTDPEKKEELQFEYSEYERKFRKRFVGNCCFIGDLFNQHLVHPKIMEFCIAYLMYQRSDESVECLCNLLKISGKGLERWCNLNDTFENLKTLTTVKNMSSRIRFMILDIVELRRNKWLPRTRVGK